MNHPDLHPEPSQRIVLLGTHGQRNIGDELLLETFLDQLGSQHSYVVNTYDTAFTRAQLGNRYNVELIDTARDKRALLRALHRSDRLVFAGGSIVKELNARTTGRSPYGTLLMLLAIVIYARWIARIPRAMLNIGVGPIRTSPGRCMARMILSQVDLVTVRDWRSYELATSVVSNSDHIHQATDAVWADSAEWFLGSNTTDPSNTDSSNTDSSNEVSEHSSGSAPVKVALNLNSDIADADALRRFTETMQQAFLAVAAEHPIEIHLLPMQEGFKEHDDVEMLDEFAAGLDGIEVVRHRPADARGVAEVLHGCDVLVSERLHAIVIASILGLPSLPLAYDVKVAALADQLGLDDRVIDINQPFTLTQATEALSSTIDERRAIAATVRARAASLGSAATRNFASARSWLGAKDASLAWSRDETVRQAA